MPETYSHHEQHNEPRAPDLRASDRDRDAVANVLREQHVAGRLEAEEFQERLDRCYAAKIYRELDELIADLPPQQTARPAPRPWRWRLAIILALLVAAIVLSHGHLLWLAVPLFFVAGGPRRQGFAERRGGWPFWSCGSRRMPRGTYV